MTYALAVTCLLLTANCSPVTAQVAIGGDGTVTEGAVLDLSQGEGGLMLPQFADTTAAPGVAGMMMYSQSDGQVYTFNGTVWKLSGNSPAPAPTGACEDYIAGSWQVGKLCWYPTDASADINWHSAFATGCPVGWRMPLIDELILSFSQNDQPKPIGWVEFGWDPYWSASSYVVVSEGNWYEASSKPYSKAGWVRYDALCYDQSDDNGVVSLPISIFNIANYVNYSYQGQYASEGDAHNDTQNAMLRCVRLL
jgi:hypothetical protein